MPAKDELKKEMALLVEEGGRICRRFSDHDDQYGEFLFDYQSWYSRALRMLETVAPDRYGEFRNFYEPKANRKDFNPDTYVIQDYFRGLALNTAVYEDFDPRTQASVGLYNQYAILSGIFNRIDSVLTDVEGTLLAEIQDAEIETASGLIKVSPRAAGALAGCVLERHLQKVALTHKIKVKSKSPTVADLNDPLKAALVYETPTWRKISYLADIRNLCSHQKSTEPSVDEAKELISGVNWVTKNVM